MGALYAGTGDARSVAKRKPSPIVLNVSMCASRTSNFPAGSTAAMSVYHMPCANATTCGGGPAQLPAGPACSHREVAQDVPRRLRLARHSAQTSSLEVPMSVPCGKGGFDAMPTDLPLITGRYVPNI